MGDRKLETAASLSGAPKTIRAGIVRNLLECSDWLASEKQLLKWHRRHRPYWLQSASERNGQRVLSSLFIDADYRPAFIYSVCTPPESRNKGYAYELLCFAIRHFFQTYNTRRVIYLDVLATNEAAKHLYTKLGFQQRGNEGRYIIMRLQRREFQRRCV